MFLWISRNHEKIFGRISVQLHDDSFRRWLDFSSKSVAPHILGRQTSVCNCANTPYNIVKNGALRWLSRACSPCGSFLTSKKTCGRAGLFSFANKLPRVARPDLTFTHIFQLHSTHAYGCIFSYGDMFPYCGIKPYMHTIGDI